MISDRSGDMGFMEAMISMMAVTVILGMYLAFVAVSVPAVSDPLSDLDEDGIIPVYDNGAVYVDDIYLSGFMADNSISGMTVDVIIPYFSDPVRTFSSGVTEGQSSSASFMCLIEYSNGRNIPCICEVTVYL